MENLSVSGDLREAAANFFRALRRLDDDPRVEILYALPLPARGSASPLTSGSNGRRIKENFLLLSS